MNRWPHYRNVPLLKCSAIFGQRPKMAGLKGLEPSTSCVTGTRSNQAELQLLTNETENLQDDVVTGFHPSLRGSPCGNQRQSDRPKEERRITVENKAVKTERAKRKEGDKRKQDKETEVSDLQKQKLKSQARRIESTYKIQTGEKQIPRRAIKLPPSVGMTSKAGSINWAPTKIQTNEKQTSRQLNRMLSFA